MRESQTPKRWAAIMGWFRATKPALETPAELPSHPDPEVIPPSALSDSPSPSIKPSHQVTQLLGRIPDLKNEVDGILAELEKSFLEVGNILDVLPTSSEALVKRTKRILKLAKVPDRDEDLFSATLTFLHTPLDFLTLSSYRRNELVTELEAASREISEILRSEADLKQTIAPLTYLQMNFRIESASLEVSLQQMFLALVGEINRLNGQVQEMFAARFKQLREVKTTLDQLVVSQRLQNEREEKVFYTKKREIETALAQLQQSLQEQAERDRVLDEISNEINGGVQQFVFGLQSQDILSQKLVHARQALGELAQLPVNTGEENAALLVRIAPVARIQSAQLLKVSGEFSETYDRLTHAAEGIVTHVGTAEAGCAASAKQLGAEGLVQVLLNGIGDVRTLLTQAVDGIRQYHQAIRPLGGLATNIKATINDLSANIHLIALNSQIKASQVPQGAALEVLAEETAVIAERTSKMSEQLASNLDGISVGLDRFVVEFQELAQRGEDYSTLMGNEGAQHEASIGLYRDQAKAELDSAGAEATKVKSSSGQILDCLRRVAHLPAELGELAKILEHLGEEADSFIREHAPHLAAQTDQTLSDLLKNYTMESEREIHLQVVNARSKSASDVPASGEEAKPSSPSTDVASARPPTDSGTGNLELF